MKFKGIAMVVKYSIMKMFIFILAIWKKFLEYFCIEILECFRIHLCVEFMQCCFTNYFGRFRVEFSSDAFCELCEIQKYIFHHNQKGHINLIFRCFFSTCDLYVSDDANKTWQILQLNLLMLSAEKRNERIYIRKLRKLLKTSKKMKLKETFLKSGLCRVMKVSKNPYS